MLIITNQKNLPIAVLTADCAPILIFDKKTNRIIGAGIGRVTNAGEGIARNSYKIHDKKRILS